MGIPDYPLHALIGFNHYYQRYGDFNTILSYRDRIEQLLKLYETLQDERGFISANVGVSWGFVPGWATRRGPDKKGTPTYAQMGGQKISKTLPNESRGFKEKYNQTFLE